MVSVAIALWLLVVCGLYHYVLLYSIAFVASAGLYPMGTLYCSWLALYPPSQRSIGRMLLICINRTFIWQNFPELLVWRRFAVPAWRWRKPEVHYPTLRTVVTATIAGHTYYKHPLFALFPSIFCNPTPRIPVAVFARVSPSLATIHHRIPLYPHIPRHPIICSPKYIRRR